MNYICPEHKVEFVQRPAGVSKKTGRSYEAFWACPTYGCRQKPLGEDKHDAYKGAQSDQVAMNGEKVVDEQVRRSYRIERQHSHEMAIRYLEMKYKFYPPLDEDEGKLAEKVRYMTDWFMKDLGE